MNYSTKAFAWQLFPFITTQAYLLIAVHFMSWPVLSVSSLAVYFVATFLKYGVVLLKPLNWIVSLAILGLGNLKMLLLVGTLGFLFWSGSSANAVALMLLTLANYLFFGSMCKSVCDIDSIAKTKLFNGVTPVEAIKRYFANLEGLGRAHELGTLLSPINLYDGKTSFANALEAYKAAKETEATDPAKARFIERMIKVHIEPDLYERLLDLYYAKNNDPDAVDAESETITNHR